MFLKKVFRFSQGFWYFSTSENIIRVLPPSQTPVSMLPFSLNQALQEQQLQDSALLQTNPPSSLTDTHHHLDNTFKQSETVQFVIKLPTSGATTFHTYLGQTLKDFLYDIRSEDRSVKQVEMFAMETEDGQEKEVKVQEIKNLAEVLRGNSKLLLKLNGELCPIDLTPIQERLKTNEILKVEVEKFIKQMKEKQVKLEKQFGRRDFAFKLSFAIYLSVQLGVVVHLTYDIGWDIMEPVTYLLGLGASIIYYGIFLMTRMEFRYDSHFSSFISRWREKYLVKRGFDFQQFYQQQALLKFLKEKHGDFANLKEIK